MKLVRQVDRSGCGLACVAMLAGVSYDDVRRVWLEKCGGEAFKLSATGNGAGLTQGDLMRLCEHFGVVMNFATAPTMVLVPGKPPWGSHLIVIDADGNTFDPQESQL
jgi:hypothetical protein